MPTDVWSEMIATQGTDPLKKEWMFAMRNATGSFVTSAASGPQTKARAETVNKEMERQYSAWSIDSLTPIQKFFGGQGMWVDFAVCKYQVLQGSPNGVTLSDTDKVTKDVVHRGEHLAKAAQATTSLNSPTGWLMLAENLAGAVGGEEAEQQVEYVAGAVKSVVNGFFTAVKAVKDLETEIGKHKWFAATLAKPDFEDVIEEANETLVDMSRGNGPSFMEYWNDLKSSCTFTSVICMDDTCFIGTGYTIEQAVEAVLEEVSILYMVQLVPGANGQMISRAQLKADRSGEGWPAKLFDFSKVKGYTINVSESSTSEDGKIFSILMALLRTNASLLKKAVVTPISYSDIVEIPPSLLQKTPAELASDKMTKNTDGSYNFTGARDATITGVALLSASEYGSFPGGSSPIPPGSAVFAGGVVSGTAPDGRKFIDGQIDYQHPVLYKLSEIKITVQGTPTTSGGFTGATITGRFSTLTISYAKIVV